MNDMLNSLEGFDSGSNYKFGDKMLKSSNPRSVFDLSHLNTLTIPNAGMLIPIALWETLPSDEFDINVDTLLRVMPQVVPLYSRQRLYVYGFWSRYSDLWNNWQVFIDKGYTGNVEKTIPSLHGDSAGQNDGNFIHVGGDNHVIHPDSLFDYIGLPIGASTESISEAGISALPFMMYLRIYRDYFMNKNEWINDRVILPDDDSRFRLGDDGILLSAKDNGKTLKFDSEDNDLEYVNGFNYYRCGLLYHDYPDDYFTSALPFTQRGTASQLSFNVDVSDINASTSLNFNDSKLITELPDGTILNAYESVDNLLISKSAPPIYQTPFYMSYADVGSSHPNQIEGINDRFKTQLNKGTATTILSGDRLTFGITLEDIRRLAVEQLELERMARTDGSYKQFGLSFFGTVSKAAYDFRPTYIGGTYKNIAFTEVLQTSGSSIPTTAESGSSPLGAYAGHGITGISNGRIGHIKCDDYGLVMLIACIMPDTYYSQGLDKIFTESLQSEKFMPDRVKLGMQPILNKELYYQGDNGNDEGEDNYLWAYQNPFDHLRYMPNKIHGKIADPNNKTFFPYTQSRKFDDLPNWGRYFSEANDVRKDYLFAKSEDAYSAQFSINVRAVRPLPYKPVPAQII